MISINNVLKLISNGNIQLASQLLSRNINDLTFTECQRLVYIISSMYKLNSYQVVELTTEFYHLIGLIHNSDFIRSLIANLLEIPNMSIGIDTDKFEYYGATGLPLSELMSILLRDKGTTLTISDTIYDYRDFKFNQNQVIINQHRISNSNSIQLGDGIGELHIHDICSNVTLACEYVENLYLPSLNDLYNYHLSCKNLIVDYTVNVRHQHEIDELIRGLNDIKNHDINFQIVKVRTSGIDYEYDDTTKLVNDLRYYEH